MLFIKNYIAGLKKSHLARGTYSSLKIALVADSLTQASLEVECQVKVMTPGNYSQLLRQWKPDLIFVESAWQGYRNAWRYKIAEYPSHPERDNRDLRNLLREAREAGVPAVFWNKEDDVHYERFLESARLFDYIFTVDENCVPRYKRDVPAAMVVEPLMFSVQPYFHHPGVAIRQSSGRSCFVGSYGTHVHPRRRAWQDMLFETFSPIGLDVYDRNSSRKADHYRYPKLPGLRVRSSVPYAMTAGLYRSYKYNLNVNTIESSPTMFSRRLIEILAVGGVAISTPSLAALRLFSDCCHIVKSRDELEAVVNWSEYEYGIAAERAAYGAVLIARDHTWARRLEQLEIAKII